MEQPLAAAVQFSCGAIALGASAAVLPASNPPLPAPQPAEEMVYITLDEDGRTRGKVGSLFAARKAACDALGCVCVPVWPGWKTGRVCRVPFWWPP